MSNIANIQKLSYCGHKSGNRSTCANVATHQVKLCKKGLISDEVKLKIKYDNRCDCHKNTGTTSYKVYEISLLDQSCTVTMINRFLTSLLGRSIKSSFHTARSLEVRFLKKNCSVMCYQPISKKWKLVYYNQIETILS